MSVPDQCQTHSRDSQISINCANRNVAAKPKLEHGINPPLDSLPRSVAVAGPQHNTKSSPLENWRGVLTFHPSMIVSGRVVSTIIQIGPEPETSSFSEVRETKGNSIFSSNWSGGAAPPDQLQRRKLLNVTLTSRVELGVLIRIALRFSDAKQKASEFHCAEIGMGQAGLLVWGDSEIMLQRSLGCPPSDGRHGSSGAERLRRGGGPSHSPRTL
ncbi:hypothetical protein DFH08DRAFT_819065 [Mycena albidolilacea]|uniref:Uncharacterized protein n=1 Tax=Mycena albidolilacea TaxID=1033008 RepID=A0AAD6ZF87_9AGAR|nr:hypothetical protein DFH08DRAFT_819065 [Mycena albidolilacea]